VSHRWCLIANPYAGGGRTAGRLGELRSRADEALGGAELWVTEGPGHASELAARAAAEGFDRVVAIGGDGTVNEVVNGLFSGTVARSDSLALGVFNAGSGGDLVKTLQVPADARAAFAGFARAAPRPIDLLHLRVTTSEGPVERLAVNVVGFGMSGAVVERANRSSKRWGGRATYLAATIRALGSDRPSDVRVTWAGADGAAGAWSGTLSSAFVANGQFCGGGMWVGRGSAIDDGLADVTLIPDLPLARMILGSPRLFTGTMERVKGVSRVAVRQLTAIAESETLVLVDVDGEQPGFLPLTVTVIPRALLIIH
jgi:diacylglycerol kinase (ATP)